MGGLFLQPYYGANSSEILNLLTGAVLKTSTECQYCVKPTLLNPDSLWLCHPLPLGPQIPRASRKGPPAHVSLSSRLCSGNLEPWTSLPKWPTFRTYTALNPRSILRRMNCVTDVHTPGPGRVWGAGRLSSDIQTNMPWNVGQHQVWGKKGKIFISSLA